MCTAWIDGFNGIAHHLAQNVDLRSSPQRIYRLCEAMLARGWGRLRLLSAGSSTFKYDLGSEDKEGNQDSAISVFTRERGIDELVAIWNILDLTRQGRGEFYAKLEYPQAA
jgi:predicted dithiol-disulfide oxidoreductase (DUF899 family)